MMGRFCPACNSNSLPKWKGRVLHELLWGPAWEDMWSPPPPGLGRGIFQRWSWNFPLLCSTAFMMGRRPPACESNSLPKWWMGSSLKKYVVRAPIDNIFGQGNLPNLELEFPLLPHLLHRREPHPPIVRVEVFVQRPPEHVRPSRQSDGMDQDGDGSLSDLKKRKNGNALFVMVFSTAFSLKSVWRVRIWCPVRHFLESVGTVCTTFSTWKILCYQLYMYRRYYVDLCINYKCATISLCPTSFFSQNMIVPAWF